MNGPIAASYPQAQAQATAPWSAPQPNPAIIPPLWRLEIANAFLSTIRLADRHTLTIYDATYLELAQRRALPLATLDTHSLTPAIDFDIYQCPPCFIAFTF